ncbi:3'(2'),5'-bisphosphate nucleotidase CysQ [Variovorax paradoxus]|uniref:3'(2'),5'-bisphosphate nucleotidase CysQ n=1 Tax=Variovorax paradoxus TaxID=34073 RepID=UPI0027887311|nr:3'(2'),5'-bisphosphate nucleotidase CysQ [Variovorax paradoxus]MDQ0589041.1 3'(2'), 5'-bisphosphate nucleotidase [Variovorax paradoxus]
MRQVHHQALLEQLLPLARTAGSTIMSVYDGSGANVQYKDDASPVTEADLAAHRVLATRLTPLLPGCPVVSEEDLASQVYRRAGRFWLVDPLDGTKEFIARNGEFTVNIALIEDGHSVLGVVYAPAIDALYCGGAGLSAFRCIRGQTVAIKVAAAQTGRACRVVASKSHLNDATRSLIDRLGEVSLAQAGSSLKFCRVAEGEADIYPRLAPTCEWDTAAAQAILEGAGGAVVDLQGRPLQYGKADVLNPSFIAARDTALIPA